MTGTDGRHDRPAADFAGGARRAGRALAAAAILAVVAGGTRPQTEGAWPQAEGARSRAGVPGSPQAGPEARSQIPPAIVEARVREGLGLLRSSRLASRMEGLRRLRSIGPAARAPLERYRGAFHETFEYNVRLAIDWLLLRIPVRPQLLLVPGGTFAVGSDPSADHNPRRTVRLGSFQIDRYEVTRDQYGRYLRARLARGSRVRRPGGWKSDTPPERDTNLPVTGISWEEARAFAAWRGMRLPTAEEWEVAARGSPRPADPQGTRYPWGDTFQAGMAQVSVDSVQPVGTSPRDRSRYGCEDMIGNVREWVVVRDAAGRKTSGLRGGAYTTPGEDVFVRPTRAYTSLPARGDPSTGFRCARDLPERKDAGSPPTGPFGTETPREGG